MVKDDVKNVSYESVCGMVGVFSIVLHYIHMNACNTICIAVMHSNSR